MILSAGARTRSGFVGKGGPAVDEMLRMSSNAPWPSQKISPASVTCTHHVTLGATLLVFFAAPVAYIKKIKLFIPPALS